MPGFHWGLVAAVAAARLTADEVRSAHGIAGDTVAALAGVRLVRGLAVRLYARFGRFLRGPGATAACLGDVLHRRERRHLGHIPAGAAMIVALLLRLSGTAVSGWLSAEPDRVALLPGVPGIATAARADDDDGGSYGERCEAALEAAHEALAALTLLLAALHRAAWRRPPSATARTSSTRWSPAGNAPPRRATSSDAASIPLPLAVPAPAVVRAPVVPDGRLTTIPPPVQPRVSLTAEGPVSGKPQNGG
ncbi:hypothetical protein [Albidovulum sp.]|uniref:cytochrome b/b6 domain-containing protein n=1 Tax=Albidovulum sp. TaxID=1872424 RepID=UPI0039B9A029